MEATFSAGLVHDPSEDAAGTAAAVELVVAALAVPQAWRARLADTTTSKENRRIATILRRFRFMSHLSAT
jgi:hypothetical protein